MRAKLSGTMPHFEYVLFILIGRRCIYAGVASIIMLSLFGYVICLFPFSIQFAELKNSIETQITEVKTQLESKCVMQ